MYGKFCKEHITDNTAVIVSSLSGLFDISPNLSFNETAEEAEFRKLMQWKKKKRELGV